MMNKVAIHQFHSGSAYGDAVTSGMFLIQGMLRRLGFISEVFVQHIAPELKERVKDYRKLKVTRDDVVFIHHSLGHDLTDWVLGLTCHKILVYHNITPETYFPENSDGRRYSAIGRKQLLAYLPGMRSAVAVSEYNAEELRRIGYRDVHVIPLLLDIDTLTAREYDDTVVQHAAGSYTLLCVGRVCANKCQTDCVAVAHRLKDMIKRPFRLVIVGGYDVDDPCYRQLAAMIDTLNLNDEVLLTGKISDEQLGGWYRAADVYLCMSEHEGFGVPLIEAMAFAVPVIAFKSSNVPHTLGGAGILVTEKDHESIAALIKILSEDRALKRAVVRVQRNRVTEFTEVNLLCRLSAFLNKEGIGAPKPLREDAAAAKEPMHYQIEGPFESSYSLAIVNREVAFALNRMTPEGVGLFATEGPGDYDPDPAVVRSVSGLEAIWKKGRKGSRADVVVRNLYPPRVSDMDGGINLLYFSWEESMLPFEWVDQFNRHLDGLPVPSEFIRKILIDNGVGLPIITAGHGMDHIHGLDTAPRPKIVGAETEFKFLHISSCFPRKGVDVLLSAYARNFTQQDRVRLIIKTFPNIHNTLEMQVEALKWEFPDVPPIDIINREMRVEEIADLYRNCHALVAPSRGEGFGLPMAEAMASGLPVITTGYCGQTDFCTEETSWLIDFSFQPSRSHMGLFNSVWMEPDARHLGKLMREVRYATQAQLQPRVDAAANRIRSEFTWDRCATRLKTLEDRILLQKPLSRKRIRVGWISSWNSKCGIAAYSKYLIDNLPPDEMEVRVLASQSEAVLSPDGENVVRCWTDQNGPVDGLLAALKEYPADVLVIQFNFAFFSPRSLEKILRFTKQRGMVSILFLHRTADVTGPGLNASLSSIRETLVVADRILVHGIPDLNRLKSWGVYRNTTLFPHGVIRRASVPVAVGKRSAGIPDEKTVVATYGFLLPHKGMEQLIEAMALLRPSHPRLHLLMVNALYPIADSQETLSRCMNAVRAHNLVSCVTLVTDFLDDEQSLALLDAASMVVFPYQETAESASGAVRFGLAARRPVVCTPLGVFADVRGLVHTVKDVSARGIAEGIDALLQDPQVLQSSAVPQNEWISAHAWDRLSKRLAGMIQGLLLDLANGWSGVAGR